MLQNFVYNHKKKPSTGENRVLEVLGVLGVDGVRR